MAENNRPNKRKRRNKMAAEIITFFFFSSAHNCAGPKIKAKENKIAKGIEKYGPALIS